MFKLIDFIMSVSIKLALVIALGATVAFFYAALFLDIPQMYSFSKEDAALQSKGAVVTPAQFMDAPRGTVFNFEALALKKFVQLLYSNEEFAPVIPDFKFVGEQIVIKIPIMVAHIFGSKRVDMVFVGEFKDSEKFELNRLYIGGARIPMFFAKRQLNSAISEYTNYKDFEKYVAAYFAIKSLHVEGKLQIVK